MGKTTVVLSLPDDVVESFRSLAEANNRTVEDLIAETVTAHQPADSFDKLLAPLANYSSEKLWEVVNQHLNPTQQQRLDELNDKIESSIAFSDDEQAEMDALTHRIETQMLLRSEALVLLQERGVDIQTYLNNTELNEE